MLLKKRPLGVQFARCSRRTGNKQDMAATSQQNIKLDVPKWSDYFPPSSDKEKICKFVIHNGSVFSFTFLVLAD